MFEERVCPECKQVWLADIGYKYELCPLCRQEQIDKAIAFLTKMNIGGFGYDS